MVYIINHRMPKIKKNTRQTPNSSTNQAGTGTRLKIKQYV